MAGNAVVFGFDRDASGGDALNASSHNKRKIQKKGGIGKKRGDAASNSTAKNDQKTESTLARFVGRFEILAGEKRFDRREGGRWQRRFRSG